uniref:Thioredoxin domain containing 16 n=1 Tax=Labrus bergylta TaxID=56723 RepID=A0A3Q3FGV6_9LABR
MFIFGLSGYTLTRIGPHIRDDHPLIHLCKLYIDTDEDDECLSSVSPTVSLFLVELEKSVEALQDYGVLVGKVNCNKELVHTHCTDERALHTAFLFRGGKEFLGFDLDTVFDVNSIVSEVLFAILREEVKYVHTDADLLAMEKAARGKKDLVLGYVRSLGTQEHRSMMETAYVYGSKYQFILITGGPLSHSSQVWFLHCRLHSSYRSPMTSERCPLTRMRKPLSTLSLHSFLQLMEAPLVSEVYEDPSSVQPPVFPYQQTPQVFLFARPATEHLDRETAVTLAWRLRGLALLVLVHRYMLDDFTQEVTSCFHAEAFLLILLECIDRLFTLFSAVCELDDEVAASLYENRGDLLDMDSITQLTSENFHAAVAQSSLTVVLFYLRWDAVAMAFLSSYIEVAERLEGSEVQMCAVDCGEWTDLCAAQTGGSPPIPFRPITAFPSVLLLRPRESAQQYRGMLGTEPELTVENLPSFLSLGKALLLLFVGEEEDEIGWRQNQALLEEMRGVVELGGGKMERYLACWIHLGRTPAGMSVLGSYLGSMPPLPALVLTHLPSGDEIYQYPSNTPIGAPAVLQWLQRVEDGKESPAGKEDWPPAHDFYDFLKVMDMQEPESAQQRTPSAHDHYEDVDEATVEGNDVEEGTGSSSSSRLSAPDNNANLHSEL